MTKAYDKLEQIFSKVITLRSASGILHWDSSTMMPEGGAAARAQQLATIEVICNEEISRPEISDLIAEAKEASHGLNEWQKANLREMERIWKHENSIPKKLVEEMSRAASECEFTWRTARKHNDFKSYEPKLTKVVSYVREISKLKGQALGVSPYEALIDAYDPGRKLAEIENIFSDLEGFLETFVDKAIDFQKRNSTVAISHKAYSKEKQKELFKVLMSKLGFDFNCGRLDESLHPFCGGYTGDVRITTRYDEKNLLEGLMGILHETGHALYDANLPPEWLWQPVGQPMSMTLHESQSLFVEMQLCRSHSFMEFLVPYLSEYFDADLWDDEAIYRSSTKVERSLIRVGADEVTYPLHVIMRFELEKKIIAGELEIADLPDAWNQYMKDYVGIVPFNDADGCMQDIHWSDGTFGYFPCYTLGAVLAAQLFEAIDSQLGDVRSLVKQGDFAQIIGWLAKNVHKLGMLYYSPRLAEVATGKPLGTEAFKRHLEHRYLK